MRRKKKRRLRRKIRRFIKRAAVLAVLGMTLFVLVGLLKRTKILPDSDSYDMKAPVQRTESEVMERLEELAKKNKGFREIVEHAENYPLFLQWDERWGYAAYGSSSIGISGCGPTCLSMVVYGLTDNAMATPDKVARYSEEQGYYIEGTGTSWDLMTTGAASFGVTGEELSLDGSWMNSIPSSAPCGKEILPRADIYMWSYH